MGTAKVQREGGRGRAWPLVPRLWHIVRKWWKHEIRGGLSDMHVLFVVPLSTTRVAISNEMSVNL